MSLVCMCVCIYVQFENSALLFSIKISKFLLKKPVCMIIIAMFLNDIPYDYLSFMKLHFIKLLKHLLLSWIWVLLLQDFTVQGGFSSWLLVERLVHSRAHCWSAEFTCGLSVLSLQTLLWCCPAAICLFQATPRRHHEQPAFPEKLLPPSCNVIKIRPKSKQMKPSPERLT